MKTKTYGNGINKIVVLTNNKYDYPVLSIYDNKGNLLYNTNVNAGAPTIK
jgi:hypothetical protein